MPTSHSLLRYPGGKTYLAPFLRRVLEANQMLNGTYVEPFAGSAGAALRLLAEGHVSQIILGDIDPVVSSFWELSLKESDALISFIRTVPLDIKEWHKQREAYFDVSRPLQERAYAFFYLNRTNRSGVLFAGPIGGKKQDGKYLLGARFNREGLISRARTIADLASSIDFRRSNAVTLCRAVAAEHTAIGGKYFLYLDPPYYEWGPELYISTFSPRQHMYLASALAQIGSVPWLLSSDCHPDAIETYSRFNQAQVSMNYSIHQHRKATELLVWPSWTKMPKGFAEGSKASIRQCNAAHSVPLLTY